MHVIFHTQQHDLKRYIQVTSKIIIDTLVCLNETDAIWSISWPIAASGETVLQKCPGGAESLGMHYNLK